MNETTRVPHTPASHGMLGKEPPAQERSPQSYKPREAPAPGPSETVVSGSGAGGFRHLVSLAFAVLWLGALGGYLWGFYGRDGAPLPEPRMLVLALGIAFVPIFIVAVLVEIVAQARKLGRLSRHLAKAAQRAAEFEGQFGAAAHEAGLAVRRELDVLTAALDATLARVAAVEEMLTNQVGAIERAGSEAQERAQGMRDLLQGERLALSGVAEELVRSTETIAQTMGSHIAASRQASQRAEEELRAAEASLSRQIDSITLAAVEAGRASSIKLDALKDATQALDEAARQSLVSADGLGTRLNSERSLLLGAAERLQEMSRGLDGVLAQARALVERAEKSVASLVQGIGTSLGEAGVRVDAAFEGARARAGEASRALRSEAESAAAAGSAAAQSIEAAAHAARRAAEDIRTALTSEIATLAGTLAGGTRSLEDTAESVTRSTGGASEATKKLVSSLEESLHTVEGASQRLFRLLETIAERAQTAKGTLDEASGEMEKRLEKVPELAAEHAQRLSSLLEDQAARMSALAQALGAAPRSKPAREAAALSPPAQAAPLQTPAAAAQAIEDEGALAPTPSILSASKDEARPSGGSMGASVRRFSLRRRRDASEPAAHALEAQAPEQEAEGTTGGFWSALFSRIEDEPASERAQAPAESEREPEQDFESSALAVIEGLHALAIDLDRLLEEEPPLELWKRYRSGERNVFARRLLTLKGQGIEERIRHKYRDDAEFRDHADHYVEHFEELLARAREHDRERVLEDTYLSSHTGKLYQLIKDALGG